MPTTPPSITAAGSIPDPSDRGTYNARAYAFMTWMKNAVTQFSDVATNVFNNATEAFNSATTASAASTAAVTAAAATQWVSGTTYVLGVCVWSTISGQTYRRIIAGAGTTDPSADSTNWAQISGAGQALVQVSTTTVNAAAGQHLALNNVAITTVTLPATPGNGDTVWVTPCNGLTTNVIARNGKLIMGLAEDLTLDLPNMTTCLRYINSTVGWRLI